MNSQKISFEEFKNRFTSILSDEYTYISGFKNMTDHILVKHNICNHTYEVSPKMILGKKARRCPMCANKVRGISKIKPNYLESILRKRNLSKEFEWQEEYKNNNKKKHLIKHLKCNTIFEVRPNDVQQGYLACPCQKNVSQMEIYMAKALDELGIHYISQYKDINCKNKRSLVFDFYLKNHDIYIEMDGLQHFKESSLFDINYIRNNDEIKNNFIIKNYKTLIRIRYDVNYSDYKDIVLSVINGLYNQKDILIIKKGILHENLSYYGI